MSEFNLSENIGFMNEWEIKDKGDKNVHPSHKISVIEAKDVKEFIKKLKEKYEWCLHYGRFTQGDFDFIDKLAGDALLVESEQ